MYQRNKKYLISWGGSISKLTLLMWFLFIGPVSVGAIFESLLFRGSRLKKRIRGLKLPLNMSIRVQVPGLKKEEGSEWQANNGEQFFLHALNQSLDNDLPRHRLDLTSVMKIQLCVAKLIATVFPLTNDTRVNLSFGEMVNGGYSRLLNVNSYMGLVMNTPRSVGVRGK